MKTLARRTLDFLGDEDGPTVTEYGVMLALIVLLCFAAAALMGKKAKATFATLESNLPAGS